MLRFAVFFAVFAFAYAERIYPCLNNHTIACFADYMHKISGCTQRVDKPTVTSWNVPDITFDTPYFRATEHRYNTVGEGIDFVTKCVLYYDTEADVTVIGLTFPSIKLTGRELFEFHQPGTIDVTVDTSFSETFNNVVVTSQWKGEKIVFGEQKQYTEVESLDLDWLHYYDEMNEIASADPEGVVGKAWLLYEEKFDIYLREQETATGRQIADIFWNNYICQYLPE